MPDEMSEQGPEQESGRACGQESGQEHDSRHPAPAPVDAVRAIVDLARLAPSIHNTQPWRWRLGEGSAELSGDPERQLPVADPSGRNLVISCGAALHYFQTAAVALGWEAAVTRSATGAGDLLAHVELTGRGGPSDPSGPAGDELDLLRRRCTDRRRFTAWPVPGEALAALRRRATTWGARAMVVTDVVARLRLELLLTRAILDGQADRARSAEQGAWVGASGDEGIPATALPADPEPRRVPSRFQPGRLEADAVTVSAGDGLLVLGGDRDEPDGWLRTGEALSALWLEATRRGLSVVPLSQPIETESTRVAVRRDVVAGAWEPHLLLRVGWQPIGRSQLTRTPRRPLREILGA